MINFDEFPPKYDPSVRPPALTTGLIIFTFMLFVIKSLTSYTFESLILYPRAPLDLNLNSISLYSLFHVNFFHWICNIFTLATPLAVFETRNGTIHTGITLNLLTVIAALQYCIVGLIFYPNTGVIGLSGIAFLLMSYMAYHESKFKPIVHTFHISNSLEIKLYTLYVPFILAIVFMIVFPSSSLPGHLFGITTGYLLSYGYIDKLYPPSKVITTIENKLSSLINFLQLIVTFYKEEDSLVTRGSVGYKPLFDQDIEHGAANAPSHGSSTFVGETRVLGTRESTV